MCIGCDACLRQFGMSETGETPFYNPIPFTGFTINGEEQPLHARVVLKGSYTAEEFVEQVTAFQHMPHAELS